MSGDYACREGGTCPWCNDLEPEPECGHGVTFDYEAARQDKSIGADEVRRRWPRLHGECPKGCGFVGIAYASQAHYIWGDW